MAATGTSAFWMLLASFALIAAGTALMRIVPRRVAIETSDGEWFWSDR